MASLADIFTKDANATPATLNYIKGLNAKLDKYQSELNQANQELAEAKNSYEYANELFQRAQNELSIAATSYDDAKQTYVAIGTLKDFFDARTEQAKEAADLAEKSAKTIYGVAQQAGEVAKNMENSKALADGYNSAFSGNGTPYSKGILLQTLDEANSQATLTLTSLITASENSFQALADAKQVFAMASFLKNGIANAYKQIQDIRSRTMNQYDRARRSEHVARLLYNSANTKLNSAQERANKAQVNHDLMKAEVDSAILGAEGVGTTG